MDINRRILIADTSKARISHLRLGSISEVVNIGRSQKYIASAIMTPYTTVAPKRFLFASTHHSSTLEYLINHPAPCFNLATVLLFIFLMLFYTLHCFQFVIFIRRYPTFHLHHEAFSVSFIISLHIICRFWTLHCTCIAFVHTTLLSFPVAYGFRSCKSRS